MQAALTLDSQERASVASFRLFFAFSTSLFIANMTLRFVGWFGGGDQARGFMLTALFYALIMITLHLICFKNTREVVETKVEKIPYKAAFASLKGNGPVLILAFAFLVYGFFNYGRSATALYYFTYNAGNRMIFATYSLFNMGGQMAGTLLMPFVARKLKNKASVPRIGWAVGGIMLLAMFLIDPQSSIVVLFGLQLICSLGFGMAASMVYGMVPDTTEYTQHKYGLRASGFISAVINFFLKVGMAFGTAGVGWIMALCGYIPNKPQTPEVLMGIRVMFTLVPGILALFAVFLLAFYKLDKSTYNTMVCELQEK
jgi:GPH family glycoside/pentoside/hexuronide:cation symporter/probable glucitol transport protein GutA